MNYASEIDQAWLRYWVALNPYSALRRFLREPSRTPVFVHHQARLRVPPVQPRTPKSSKARAPRDRAARQLQRQVDRVTRLPQSEWAKSIIGDGRINQITLQDVLDGIEDYFEVFEQVRRVSPPAYDYFSRVGAPIITRNSMIRASAIEENILTVGPPAQLPAYFGVFLSNTKQEYHAEIIGEKPTLFDFHLFEKPKNHGTIAPFGSTIFTHNTFSLRRNAFTREERRKFPWVRHSWGMCWYVGVLPDGTVRVLPQRMTRDQTLPNGDQVHHSAFQVPEGVVALGGKKGPHHFARLWFNIAVAFTASGLAGVTVTIRQGKRTARVGVPVANLRSFFADRDPASEGARRKAIMHFRHGHDRYMPDGRIIAVGEHLSGERHFFWRGYDVTVGVPGVHFPVPEVSNGYVYVENDPDAPLPPEIDPKKLVSMAWAGDRIKEVIGRRQSVRMRRGEPEMTYKKSVLTNRDPD